MRYISAVKLREELHITSQTLHNRRKSGKIQNKDHQKGKSFNRKINNEWNK
jgi:hypothetical protein